MFKNCVLKVSVDTKKWVKKASVRAVKTMAQTALAMIPVAISVTQVDWVTVLGTAATAGIISICTSVAGIPEVEAEGE